MDKKIKKVWSLAPDCQKILVKSYIWGNELTIVLGGDLFEGIEKEYRNSSCWCGDGLKTIRTGENFPETQFPMEFVVDRQSRFLDLNYGGDQISMVESVEDYEFSGDWIIDPRSPHASKSHFKMNVERKGDVFHWMIFSNRLDKGFAKGSWDRNTLSFTLGSVGDAIIDGWQHYQASGCVLSLNFDEPGKKIICTVQAQRWGAPLCEFNLVKLVDSAENT